MKKEKIIVVAYDFTERGDIAMQHALIIGKPMRAKIVMLHIYSNDKQRKNLETKIDAVKGKYEYDFEIETNLIKGNITKSIKQFTDYSKAILVILGTKNPSQGFERIFGGQILKIIMGGDTPYIVVRDKPHYDSLRNIIMPINFDFSNKQKLRWVRMLSNYFSINVQLFVQNEHNIDDRESTKANFLFAKRYLDKYKIQRKTIIAPKGVAFRESLIEHAYKSKSDMIMIMNSDHLSFIDYLIGADEEYVIANDYKIPVMCVNPRIDLMYFSDFF